MIIIFYLLFLLCLDINEYYLNSKFDIFGQIWHIRWIDKYLLCETIGKLKYIVK